MNFVVPQITLPIQSTTATACRRFPVNRIYCIGRNYRDHVAEMGGDPDRDPPVFFQKPTDAVVEASSTSCIIPVSALPLK